MALQVEGIDMLRRVNRGVDSAHVATALASVGSSLEAAGKRKEGAALAAEAVDMRMRLLLAAEARAAPSQSNRGGGGAKKNKK